jgi:hypothetical protein
MRGPGARIAAMLAVPLLVVAFASTGSAAVPSARSGASWLASQQESDGGFELADFPGFETPDAVLAIAAAAQGSTWDVCTARTALAEVRTAGLTGLDALDDLAEQQGDDVGIAAKLIVLDVLPLGLDARDFDPSGDSAAPVDLLATVLAAARPDGQFKVGALNATALSVIALHEAQGVVTAPSLTYLDDVQTADGSWHYGDVDTTALALQALLAVGRSTSDATVVEGFAYLARAQNADGSWNAYGTPDPNSTATALMALRAAGLDPASGGWRAGFAPELAAAPYGSPVAFLEAQQQGDGRIASPNDSWGVNTFATSQAVQALAGVSLPVGVAPGSVTCGGGSGGGSNPPAPGVVIGGGVFVEPPGDGTDGGVGDGGTDGGAAATDAPPNVSGTVVTTPAPPRAVVLPDADSTTADNAGVRWGITIGVGVLLGALGGGAALLARRRGVA